MQCLTNSSFDCSGLRVMVLFRPPACINIFGVSDAPSRSAFPHFFSAHSVVFCIRH